MIPIPKWNVTVWSSYDSEVEADTEEDACEKAVTESPFPYGDYCETEKIEET